MNSPLPADALADALAEAPAAFQGFNPFAKALAAADQQPLSAAGSINWLQVNLGKVCNQACKHCHVDASPTRTERMSPAVAGAVIDLLERYPQLTRLDLTGGAPEINAVFRDLVRAGRRLGRTVMDRSNLTIISEPGHEDLAEFLAAHEVEVHASLPYYLEAHTDRQRGLGVFARSIEGLKRLNALGYGTDARLVLNLIYNPVGAYLPPAQHEIEDEYRRELLARHGVVFNNLFTITNMPIARFAEFLKRTRQYDRYQRKLEAAYNPGTVSGLMCRTMLSVDYLGNLYDCDFNQMLGMPVHAALPQTIFGLDLARLERRPIVTGPHCFGCTAGSGSSCGGQLTG